MSHYTDFMEAATGVQVPAVSHCQPMPPEEESPTLADGVFFLVGSSILLSMVVQQVVAILVLSQEEMSTYPSTPPSGV